MKDKEEISYKKFLDFFKEKTEGSKKETPIKEEIEEKTTKKKIKKKIKKKKIEEKEEIVEKEELQEPGFKPEKNFEVKPEEIKEELPEAIVEVEEVKDEEFLIFRSGSENYAIYTQDASEVITGLEIFEATDLPSYAIGMANFRDRIIPVISFSKLLNIEEEKEPYSFIFIEKKDKKESFFLRVGEVKGIYKKRDVKLLEVPYDLNKEIFKKIILIDKELVPLIDVIKLVEKKE
ncbi:MAG: chemotaxis protein CheW [candidate division WOR-3 bacterium]